MAIRLFVGNLPFSTTTADMEALFAQVGAVGAATIITDRFSGQSRGFGFVEMSNDQEAETAIERFNGHEFSGRALTVDKAKPHAGRSSGERSSLGGSGRERRW